MKTQNAGGFAWQALGQPRDLPAAFPNDAYGRLLNRLVWTVTQDLRPTWRQQ